MSEPAVTRIARRRALPGHEQAYEDLVREMFELMKQHHGFRGAELIPPAEAGEHYQVVVNFASESDLAEWDGSADRAGIFERMREHAEGTGPEHRRLSVLDDWFVGPRTPAGSKPPKWRVAFVTWLGIWPLASIFIFFLAPVLQRLGLPFLAVTAVNTILIVACMTWLVAPVLTNLLKGFLHPKR
ncbi:antibiotic biosynthesis monooxygenase [Naumannella sp. ID2617S]|nr:antibiotic biosynthesis monooxygenase [Naumannella sp. ID2617S]